MTFTGDAVILLKINSVEIYRYFSVLDMMENAFLMCPLAHQVLTILEVELFEHSLSVVHQH